MKGPFKLKYKNSAFPFKGNDKNGIPKSEATGYDLDEGYFQSLLKAAQENPNPGTEETAESTPSEVITPSTISAHHESLRSRASQIQIEEYRKKQLKLNE
jgi:hypothetical protein